MKTKATVIRTGDGQAWVVPDTACCSCCGNHAGHTCGETAQCSASSAFCVKNSRNISLRPGDRVFVSCPAGQTALQAIRAVVFPFLAAAAGYILAPAGKTGGGKAAGALAAFFAAACLSAGIRVLLRKKNLLSGGEPEITGRTDSPEPPVPGDIP